MYKGFLLLTFAFVVTAGAANAYENTYAVIVAIDDYENDDVINDVPFLINGASAFYDFLTSRRGGTVPSGNICKLIDKEATRQNIIDRATALFARASRNDRVIFYFCGHGGDGGFAPYDFDGYDWSVLSYGDIKAIFRSASCGTKLLFADACSSGGLKGSSNAHISQSIVGDSSTDDMNIAVMTSCRAGENSIVTSALEMGIFSYCLIQGLGGMANSDGNAYITIQELFYYVYRQVLDKSKMKQTPQLFGKFDLRLIVAKVYSNNARKSNKRIYTNDHTAMKHNKQKLRNGETLNEVKLRNLETQKRETYKH